MGWFGFGDAERSDGDSGKTSDAWVSVKTGDDGQVTDVIVGPSGESDHDHYWNVDDGQSGGAERVDWNEK